MFVSEGVCRLTGQGGPYSPEGAALGGYGLDGQAHLGLRTAGTVACRETHTRKKRLVTYCIVRYSERGHFAALKGGLFPVLYIVSAQYFSISVEPKPKKYPTRFPSRSPGHVFSAG